MAADHKHNVPGIIRPSLGLVLCTLSGVSGEIPYALRAGDRALSQADSGDATYGQLSTH